MDTQTLKKLLSAVSKGETQVDEALSELSNLYTENIDYANIDHHRSLRKGFPEVIFGQGKTAEQICGIISHMKVHENVILATRLDHEKALAVLEKFPEANYFEDAKILVLKKKEPEITGRGTIAVISAGTSDIPIAREAAITAQVMGNHVETVFDVGVAGIHRLFEHKKLLEEAVVIVVVAGMEGALPSVIAGLVKSPVIAVPTSVGYGVSFGGLTALFAMLNSCSSNVAVVNIDNGFGAGYMAAMINKS